MRKRVFIGSSSEELGTAKIVKEILDKDFDVVIWNESVWDKSVFKLNQNFLTDLLSATLKFDYGILIGSPDDKVEVRGKEYLQARDNVLFELGLFIGRLGIDKCAFLVSDDVKIPTDFGGIKLSMYNKTNLLDKIKEIQELFLKSTHIDLNFFPSSVLASTYFENFIKYVN
ncbi:nucleotide-binding protein, partial [Tenacibaculum maritimum]